MKNVLKSMLACALVMTMILIIGCSIALADYVYLEHSSGILQPGQTISGYVDIEGFISATNVGVIVGAGNASNTGSFYFVLGDRGEPVPCNGKATSVYEPHTGVGFEPGRTFWSLTNDSGEVSAYTLAIIQDR